MDIKMDQYEDTDSFNDAVDNISHISSSTNIEDALKSSQNLMFTEKNGAREGIPKLLILITDGDQTVKKAENPKDIANEMRKKGIQLVRMTVFDFLFPDVSLSESLSKIVNSMHCTIIMANRDTYC